MRGKLVLAVIIIAILLIVFYGYDQNIPREVLKEENIAGILSLNQSGAIIEAKTDISGLIEDDTIHYGGWSQYLAWGDRCLLSAGSSREFHLDAGQKIALPIFPENVAHRAVLFHGEYVVPTVTVQRFRVTTDLGVISVTKIY